MVTAGLGSNASLSLFNFAGSVDVIVDVTGWYSTGYQPVRPGRVMDTRAGQCGFTMQAGEQREVAILGLARTPTNGANAVALNVTVTNPTAASFLTVWPSGTSRPLASNLNFVADQTVPNMVLVGTGAGGRVSVFNSSGTVDVLIDVNGWFAGSASTAQTGCIVRTPPPPPPPPTPPPPPPPRVSFGSGTYRVGVDIPAGRYEAPGGPGCYWERLRGFAGTIDDIIANDFGTSHVVVDIGAGDVGFHAEDCGTFVQYSPPPAPGSAFGDGDWVVNQQILAGTYAAPGGSSCYWERDTGFGGTLDEIIANDFGATKPIAAILLTDGGFKSDSCGVWTRIG
jgi:hypothetical protein